MVLSIHQSARVSFRLANWEAIPLRPMHPNRPWREPAFSADAGFRAISPRGAPHGKDSCGGFGSYETPWRYRRRSSSPLDIAGERDNRARLFRRCCSSVVERTLGKGEVGSSILPSSTISGLRPEMDSLQFRLRLRASVLGTVPPLRCAPFRAPAGARSCLRSLCDREEQIVQLRLNLQNSSHLACGRCMISAAECISQQN